MDSTSVLGEIKRGWEIGKLNRNPYIYHACELCGVGRWIGKYKSHPRCIKCSLLGKKGELSRSWKGGRVKDTYGYIKVRLEPDDFFYAMSEKVNHYVLEHRLVMAKHLNRCLLPWEVVHHKNGIKTDNILENLELLNCKGKHNIAINKRIKELENLVANQFEQINLLLLCYK